MVTTNSPPDFIERRRQIAFDVVVQAPQGRDVNALQAWRKCSGLVAAEKSIEDREKPGKRLPGPGGGDQDDMLVRGDQRPCELLRRRRPAGKCLFEPRAN